MSLEKAEQIRRVGYLRSCLHFIFLETSICISLNQALRRSVHL